MLQAEGLLDMLPHLPTLYFSLPPHVPLLIPDNVPLGRQLLMVEMLWVPATHAGDLNSQPPLQPWLSHCCCRHLELVLSLLSLLLWLWKEG